MYLKSFPVFILMIVYSFNSFSQTTNPFPSKNQIYKQGWIDFNKNNKKDIYEDPAQPIEKRIENLLAQMTLEEKSCQLATYYGHGKVLKDSLPTADWKNLILKDGIANIDEHINNTPRIKENETPFNNAMAMKETQRFFVEYTRLGIPVDFSNEGIRGLCARHATSFPSMNALGCTWDKELAFLQGKVQSKEARVLGYINFVQSGTTVNQRFNQATVLGEGRKLIYLG